MLAAHPQASTPDERQRTFDGAGNEVIWALAHSADREFGLDEPTPVGPLGPWSVVLDVAGRRPPALFATWKQDGERQSAEEHKRSSPQYREYDARPYLGPTLSPGRAQSFNLAHE